MSDAKKYEGVVEKTIPNGKHGPYAVATVISLGTVTFSLDSNVWKEGRIPDSGTIVVLWDLTKKVAGWRANHARFLRPSDNDKTPQGDSKE